MAKEKAKKVKKEKKRRGCGTLIIIILIFIVGMYVGQKSGIKLPDAGVTDLIAEYFDRFFDAVKHKTYEVLGKDDIPENDDELVFEEAPGVDYTVHRILYNDLSKDGKYIYRALYKAALTHESLIIVPSVSGEELKEIHTALKYDNPQIPCFGDKFTYSTVGKFCYIKLNYCYTREKCEEISAALIAKAKEICSVCEGYDDFKKELYLHDYIINSSLYSDEKDSAYNAAGIILDNEGVCSSYALSMKMLLDIAGIKSCIIHGEAEDENGNQPHAWLCVCIDEKWYHLDPTWDDPSSQDGKEILVHAYFNITTERISADHSGFDLPKGIECDSLDRNYFEYMGLYCRSSDWYDIMTSAVLKNLDGTVTELEFMFDNNEVYEDACAELHSGGLNRIIQSAVIDKGYTSFSWNTSTHLFDKPNALHYIITLK